MECQRITPELSDQTWNLTEFPDIEAVTVVFLQIEMSGEAAG